MTDPLEKLLESIDNGMTPAVILVGGNNDYLIEHAFHKIRDRILAQDSSTQIEQFTETTDLGEVLDSFRTHSLFFGKRLLLVPEVNAFVSASELASLLKKATQDWHAAKTERKRTSALAKLLHAIGLVGLDLETSDRVLLDALGADEKEASILPDMFESARITGKKVTRGEGDAALLTEVVTHGGAPGTTLLMRSGEIPAGSVTVEAIGRVGAVVACDLSRANFKKAFVTARKEIEQRHEVIFDEKAIVALFEHLGIARTLTDKRSSEVPDLRGAVSEASRLAGFVGKGKTVTSGIVDREIDELAGGVRYEFTSLVTEGKPVEAIEKLRDLVSQSRREKPQMPDDVAVGGYVLTLAEEVRQILAIQSFCRSEKIDPRRRVSYNEFKDGLAIRINAYLAEHGLVRQKTHPFPLLKRFEAAGRYRETSLVRTLQALTEMEFDRKSGGVPVQVRLETAVLGIGAIQ